MWQDKIENCYVLSIEGSNRRNKILHDFIKYDIKFKVWNADVHENGKKGVYLSYSNIFKWCILNNMGNILIFEDDVQFLLPPKEFNETMEEIVRQAQMLDWMQIKLGSVLLRPASHLVTPNLFETFGSYGLHAVAYTKEFMEKALALPESLPVDVSWSRDIESQGRCYHSFPLLAGQYKGFSDIEKCEKNWNEHIIGAFKRHTEKINLSSSQNIIP